MRNGLSLYPGYFQGSLESVQLPPSGGEFDKGNAMLNTRGAATFSGNQEMLAQTSFQISNQNSTAQQTMENNTTNSENPIALGTPIHNHYGLLNQFTSTKVNTCCGHLSTVMCMETNSYVSSILQDLCRDDALSRLHLDTSCSGNNSSPGISS